MPGGPSSRRPVGGRKIVSDSNSSAVSRWRDPSPPRSSIISTPPPPRSAVRSPPSRSIFGSPPPRSILTSPSQRSTISVGLSEPPGDEDASAWLGEDDTDSWFQLDQTVGGSKKGGRTVPSEPLVPRPKAKVPWNPANAKPKAAAKPPLAKKVPVKDPWSFAFDSDEDKKETTSAAPSTAAKVAEAPAAQAPEPAPAQADAWDVPVDAPEKVATPPPPQTKVVSAKKPAVAKPKAPVKNEDNFWDLDSYKKETKSPAPSKPAIRSKPGLLKKEVKAPIAPKPPVVRGTKTVPQTQPVPEPEVVPVPRHVPITAPEPVVEAVPEPKQPEPEHEPEAQLEPEREPEPEPAPVEEPFEPAPKPETHAAETTDPWAADVKTEEAIPHGDLSTDLDAADDLVDDKTLDAQWQEAFTTGTDSWDLGEEDIEQYVPETHEAAPELEAPAHEPTTDAWSVDNDSEQQPLAETASPAIEQQDSWALGTEAPSHIEPETEAPEPEQLAAWSFETEEPVTEPGQEATHDLEISQPDANAPATKEADPWTFDVEEPAAEEEVPEVEAHQTRLHEQPSKDTDAWSTVDNEPPAASVEPSFSAVEPVQATEQDADEVDFWSSTDHSAHPAPISDAQLPAVEDSEKPAEQADPWSLDAEEPLDEPFVTEAAEEPQISTEAAPEFPSAEEHATAEEEADAWDVEADGPAHDELVADSKKEPSQDADPWAFEVDEEAPQQEESFPEPEQVPESVEPAHTQETETEATDAGAFSFDVEEGDQDEAMNWGAADEEVAPTVEAPEINEPSSPAAQSTKSFARTVSHDVSFNDDDDADWNLSRADSDPFKFMPPSTRTNSFPSVPPATKEPTHALQSNQALDILEETEAEDQQAEATHEASTEDVMGGELHHAETEAAEARFEEGIPLLPTEAETEEAEPAQQTDHAFAHSFGDEEGDDFFNQKQQDDAEEGEPAFEPVQRKSTIQVMDRAAEGTADDEPLDVEAPTSVAAIAEEPQEESANTDGDLGSKWEAAFGDDDDEGFLPEEQDTTAPAAEDVDATGFLGSDDEGLLLEDEVVPAPAEAVQPEAPSKPAATNRYAPAAQNHQPAQLPSSVSAPSLNYNLNQSSPAPPPLPAADETKVTSFADRSKSGYSSPYDLPTDLISTRIKPRKSIQQLRNAPAPPQKDAAVTAPPPPAPGAFSKPPAQSKPSAGPPRAKENFFEELPITTKSRPQSRRSNRAPSPAQIPPMPAGPPRLPHQAAVVEEAPEVPDATQPESQPPANIAKLVAPERVDPYAALPGGGPPAPFAANANRYSPAPSQSGKSASAPPPAAASNRYSPAPVQSAHSHSQSPPQAQLPHLPRTSSPLANFEVTNGKTAGEPGHPDRRASSAYDHKASRVSSLPPTTEVDEEDDDEQPATGRSMSAAYPAGSQPQGRYSPKPTENKMPPTSPSKRAPNAYAPQAHGHQQPPRSQTQSPSTLRGKPHMSPVYEGRTGLPPPAAGSNVIKASTQSAYAGFGRPRGASLTMGFVPPTDGSENDPLNRWQGAPIIAWGVGGTMVTVFPKSIPRYGMNQSAPTTLRTSGEVKMHTIKDAAPMPERLTKFPGPLKGKSKKKEALAWLASGIDALSQDLPDVSLHQHLSLEAKRSIERLLLWKLLRVFVEHDGHLEGNPAVEQAVRDILSPTDNAAENAGMLSNGATFGSMQTSSVTAMQADAVDSGAIEQIRNDLLKGDRETAVWSAVDKRLWGHAMLIANTVSPDLYQRVAQEFVRKEVNYTGHNNESLGAFYKILSGNHDDCVDELVPSHARAGLQLMSTQVASVPTADIMDGLDKWRETLSLVLSNRSTDDIRGLKSLGQLLSSYGRAEAAQICFIFSRGISVFGGADEPNVDFVLLGADHRTQSDSFAKETEALQLSEVYEYALSLGGGAAATAGAPHLAGYKLHYAVNLAEYGMRDKALAYCDSISNAITAQTKRSPYYHPVLETAVDDFMKRLKQAPKDDSASWMSKPSMNKVSDSMWNRFNKFVAGDESDANGSGPEAESGPFARIASTPNLSRSPSVNNFDVYGGGAAAAYPASNVPPPMPLGNPATSSKYAPMGGAGVTMPPPFEYQPPVPGPASNGRSASPYTPAPYEPSYPSQLATQAPTHGYPGAPTESNFGYQPRAYEPPVPEAEPAAPVPAVEEKDSFQAPSFVPYGNPEPESTQGFQTSTYEPPHVSAPVEEAEKEDKAQEEEQGGSGGFEPPSDQPYGYEPPSYQPPPPAEEEEHDDDAPKPKKKTFMDDDNDDDIPALRDSASQEKTKEQIDKENADLVKKIAEDEAKREAEQIAAKKSAGWGFGGWFGGAKKADNLDPGKKAIRAKLGEANSFVYDPELKRWINKAAGAEQVEAAKPAPPPPKGGPRSVSGTPPPMMATPPPMPRSASTSMAPPPRPQSAGIPPPLPRPGSSAGNSGPPSRPATSMSNASSIDDLLGAAAPRKAGKKPRKSGRYVDVMAK